MKKCSLGLLGLTLTSVVAVASANAADIYRGEPAGGYKDGPVYVANTWTGFYLGVNGGYGWSNNNQLVDSDPVFAGMTPDGGFGGGQIGYNWQGGLGMSHLVLGIEADIQGSDIKAADQAFIGHTAYHYTSELDYFGTVRGRVGYAVDRALFYFTGGFAYGGLKKFSDSWGPTGGQTFDSTATGYVIGGGLEYKINPAWSVKAEYQYLNFGKNDPVGTDGSTFSKSSDIAQKDDDYHTVRVGLNYHVGAGYEPLK